MAKTKKRESGGISVNIDSSVAEAATGVASSTYLEELTAGKRRFRFAVPQLCTVSQSQGAWSHEITGLGLHGYGSTEQESFANLGRDLSACWDEIAQEVDDNLSADAIALKALLVRSVRVSPVS